MSDSTQQYILKEPVKAQEGTSMRHGDIFVLAPDADGYSQVETSLFHELFVPLDRQALQIAIREEIREYAESMLPDYGVPIHKTERLEFLQGEQTDVK